MLQDHAQICQGYSLNAVRARASKGKQAAFLTWEKYQPDQELNLAADTGLIYSADRSSSPSAVARRALQARVLHASTRGRHKAIILCGGPFRASQISQAEPLVVEAGLKLKNCIKT